MNAIAPCFGCAAGGVPFEVAREIVLGLVSDPLPIEYVPLTECTGRVLAEPFDARIAHPRFDHSAMDGYAVRRADLTPGTWLPVDGRSAAGAAPGRLTAGGAHRILTGAPLPQGADAVIAQEHVQLDGDLLRFTCVPVANANIRRRGEDIGAGQRLIEAGTTLDWRHVGVLAAQGVRTVGVRRKPRIALLSSGRELCRTSAALAPDQIHDCNQPMLATLLRAGGAVVRAMPAVPDDPASMRDALRCAATGADLVITTAGISVGDEDHVRTALRDLGGKLGVLKVAMKPGKPLAAGRIGAAAFVGLPGNPIAALAGALAFVRPLLVRMTGAGAPPVVRAHAGFEERQQPGRTTFIPVQLCRRDASVWAERAGPDGSGRLSPLLRATGLAVLPATLRQVRVSELLEVLPFVQDAHA